MTGGTRGIGRAIAEAFAAAGAAVVVLARKPDELAETEAALAALGGRVLTSPGRPATPTRIEPPSPARSASSAASTSW